MPIPREGVTWLGSLAVNRLIADVAGVNRS